RLFRRRNLNRISGLKYLKHLLGTLNGQGDTEIFWVLSSESARQRLLQWSRREDFSIKSDSCYVAPWFGQEVQDRNLLSQIERNRPAHVIVAIGSGPQEKLGFYLRENL